jgi:hypothetical protein
MIFLCGGQWPGAADQFGGTEFLVIFVAQGLNMK